MISSLPYVSIGLPVYNGERFLTETLDSLLAQTFENFELVISDNASTDRTQEICEDYAAKDRRIRYYRNDQNLGAARNYNRVFELSTGKYFKWAAHDDLCAPQYLERCVEVLDRKPSVVVCPPKPIYIDENGEKYLYQNIKDYDDYLDFNSPRPHKRFHDYLFRPADRWNAIFGVIQASELKKTPLIGSYVLSDQVLLGELALRGEIYRVPEPLFFRRDNLHLQTAMMKTHSAKVYAVWFDPANRERSVLPTKLKAFFEYLCAIRRVRMSWHERTWCYLYTMKWGYKHLLWENCNRAYRLLKSFDKQKRLVKRLIGKGEGQ